MENNSTIVASTQEVSNALKMSTCATRLSKSQPSCPHPSGNRPGSGATAAKCEEQFWNGPYATTL